MQVFLHGLKLQFYRGIGSEIQTVAPLTEMNFFVGANNSGKSTVLKFVTEVIDMNLADTTKRPLAAVDEFRGEHGQLSAKFSIPIEKFKKLSIDHAHTANSESLFLERIANICEALAFEGLVWLEIPEKGKPLTLANEHWYEDIKPLLEGYIWENTWNLLLKGENGNIDDWIKGIVSALIDCQSTRWPPCIIIPAFRKIDDQNSGDNDYSGGGLIPKLAELQNPGHNARDDKELFDKINKFLGTVTGKPNAVIEVPHNREHVMVHMDGKTLPLSSLGTGIEEVIIIASYCTLHSNKVICIEEPEIHLHPLLQRKLIQYLAENTNNQYLIATHSASFIDTPNSSVFHVKNDGVQTTVKNVSLRNDKRQICEDLGYRASDILQANMVIWVEGPSDRIYVNHWITAIDPELIEGIHYSIMFYGGRLLSHLSADSELVESFISLRSLNQNIAILIDSDREKSGQRINDTKQRLRREIEDSGGFVWVTKGREIENYIEHSVLQKAVKTKHPKRYVSAATGGSFDHALHFFRDKAGKDLVTNADKVGVANLVCAVSADLSILDLSEKVKNLVNRIRMAN